MRTIFAIALIACGAAHADVADQRPAGLTGASWQFGPLNRWAYTHMREILPTKEISNDPENVRPIPGIEDAVDDLTLRIGGEERMLSEVMSDLYVDGMLVIRDGKAVVERYDATGGTLTPARTHLLWSVSKTVTGLTAASVAADGLIDLNKTVADYVPALANTGWGQDTLRTILDMRDSSNWTEDYDAPDSTVRRQDCSDGLLTGPDCDGIPVVGNYVFLPGVGTDEARAGRFAYKSGTTDVMAWVLEEATGLRFADLVSQRIWQPIGAEKSAGITVDVSGFTLASGGMFTTLRDLGRVGLLMVNRGKVEDRQIVPAAWLDDIFRQPGDPNWPYDSPGNMEPYYRSFVWGLGDGAGTVTARGVHGQYIYVSPLTNITIAMFSSWPNADGGAEGVGHTESLALLKAVENALR